MRLGGPRLSKVSFDHVYGVFLDVGEVTGKVLCLFRGIKRRGGRGGR